MLAITLINAIPFDDDPIYMLSPLSDSHPSGRWETYSGGVTADALGTLFCLFEAVGYWQLVGGTYGRIGRFVGRTSLMGDGCLGGMRGGVGVVRGIM
jgi:hypothetical protein